MVVELICVGTELLLGNIVNTNAQFIAEKCALLGLSMYNQVVVGDNRERLADAIRRALKRSDIVILNGGLGPTEDDLTKVSRQLDVSMGEMFQLINIFAVVLFALLIYLLTKLIIEKNANAISMVKILGYENREINSLYLTSTTWVVILSILLSLLLSTWTIYGIYGYLMSSFSGWLTLYLKPAVYPEMFAMGMGAYVLVALLQFRRIKKIPMDVALKNVE